MADIIRYAQGDSVLGPFVAALSGRGLALVAFGTAGDAMLERLRSRFPGTEPVEDPAGMGDTLARLAALIEHPETAAEVAAALPLDPGGSAFERQVWAALRDIPAGRTASYGEVAAMIGAPGAAREVAEACAANMLAVIVPCHRVVRRDGGISGYRWGVRRKRALLAREHAAAFHLV